MEGAFSPCDKTWEYSMIEPKSCCKDYGTYMESEHWAGKEESFMISKCVYIMCTKERCSVLFFFLSNSSEGDSSVNNVIEVQARRPEFKSQHPS